MLPSQPDLVGQSQHQLSGGYRFLTSMMRVQVSMGASDIKICYDAMPWYWVFIARSMVTQGGARAVQAYHNGSTNESAEIHASNVAKSLTFVGKELHTCEPQTYYQSLRRVSIS